MMHKKRIIAGCMAGVLLLSAGGVFYKSKAAKKVEVEASQDVVQKGTIRKVIQGTGTLAPVDTKEIMVPVGVKIREVKVKSGDEVKAGDVIATVDGNTVMAELLAAKENIADLQKKIQKADKSKAEYYEMLKKKENLEEKQTVLQKLKDSGTVTADAPGVILNVNDGKKKTGTSDSDKSSDSQSAGSSSVYAAGRIWPLNMQIDTELRKEEVVLIEKISEISIRNPVAGEKPDTGERPDGEDEKKQPYTIEIKWSPKTEAFAPDTVYTASVKITAAEGFAFKEGLKPDVPGAEVSDISYQKDESGRIVQISLQAVFARTEAAREDENHEQNPGKCEPEKTGSEKPQGDADAGNGTDIKKSEVKDPEIKNMDGKKSSGDETGAADIPVAAGIAGMAGGAVSSFAGTDDSGKSDESREVNTEMSPLCTIASGDKLAVEIQVDELDILSVAQGQKAEITLNAQPDKTYEGVISQINKNGVNQGGTTKYGVQILLPKEANMLFGMNVSAGIFIAEKKDVLVVPAEAVVEKGGKSWLCLSVDEKTGEPSMEQEIQTGLSDGVQIEITEGAKEGQTVYYEQSTAADFLDDYMMDEM